jgi:hypothetical protein
MRDTRTSKTLKLIAFVLLLVICQSCNSNKDQTNSEVRDSIANGNSRVTDSDRKLDSVSLRRQIITIYKWYIENEKINHNYLLTESYGIDTVKLDDVIRQMQKTDFFSEEFLTNYKQIGQRTNQMLKRDSTLRMIGIAFPFQDFDTWYSGQVGPPNLDDLTIFNLSINNDQALFKWTTTNWDSLDVRFRKENNKWKLSFLELMDLKMYQ